MFQTIISITAASIAIIYPAYSLVKRERTPASWALSAALICTALLEICDLLAIMRPEDWLFWKRAALLAEGCLPFFWLLFSLVFARKNEFRSVPIPQLFLLGLAALFIASPLIYPAEMFFYSPDFSQERMLFLGTWGFFFYLILTVFMVAALINLEVTLANATHGARWEIKFEILGAGSLMAALVFYYSQGLLYRTINMNLVPVRSIVLLLAVILTTYSQLWRAKGVKIQISRNLAYKSIVLLAVGLYLIVLGLIGEGMKYFGESFQHSLVIAVGFVLGLGFVTVLLSGTVKRKIKVFLTRNFYQEKYDYRSQWLQFTDQLSSARSGEELLARILTGYCETFGMGCGALYLNDNSPDGFSLAAKLEVNPANLDFERNEPFIGYLQESRLIADMRDMTGVPGQEKVDALRGYNITFAVPLFLNDRLDGIILLGRPININETYGIEDYDLMKTLSHQAASAILNLRLSDQLAQAKEMEVLGKISAFVVHDLKNLVYTISLMLDNAREYISEPEFQQDMLASLDNTVAKMKTLIAKLKYLPEKKGMNKRPADLLDLVGESAATINGVTIRVNGNSVIAEVDRDEFQKVVLNLLLNAVDATDGRGPVTAEVGQDSGAYLRVIDEGCGIDEVFLHSRLFAPFQSTKKSGLGIGLYQCKQIVEAHGGSIEAESAVGKGTVFTVRLPLESGKAGMRVSGDAGMGHHGDT